MMAVNIGVLFKASHGSAIVITCDFFVVLRNVTPSVLTQWLWCCGAELEVVSSISFMVATFQWGQNARTLLYVYLGAC